MDRGEEWNESFERKQALVDHVLKRWIAPGAVVLEIGPGGGRCTEPLPSLASRLIIADLSKRALELSRERFCDRTNIEYVWTSGTDLEAVADSAVDAIWSFDVFVHIAPKDQKEYVAALARVLVPSEVAVIHHADGRNRGFLPSRAGWRPPMSRRLFAALAFEQDLQIECQLNSWGPEGRYGLSPFGDAITVLRRR